MRWLLKLFLSLVLFCQCPVYMFNSGYHTLLEDCQQWVWLLLFVLWSRGRQRNRKEKDVSKWGTWNYFFCILGAVYNQLTWVHLNCKTVLALLICMPNIDLWPLNLRVLRRGVFYCFFKSRHTEKWTCFTKLLGSKVNTWRNSPSNITFEKGNFLYASHF